MKICLCVLSLGFPLLAFSQGAGSVSTVTVALTCSFTAPATKKRAEDGKIKPISEGGGVAYSNDWYHVTRGRDGSVLSEVTGQEVASKISAYKYSNKEIIQDLVDNNTLPKLGKEPYLAGWSLIRINSGGESTVYARHVTGACVNLGSVFEWYDDSPAVAEDMKFWYLYKRQHNSSLFEIKESEIVTNKTKYKTIATFKIGDAVSGRGIQTAGGQLKKLRFKTTSETYEELVYVPTASKISSILATTPPFRVIEGENGFDVSAVVEGTISASAGKLMPDVGVIIFPEGPTGD